MSDNELNNASESFSFVESELKILKFWEQNNIFKKSLEKTKNCPPYIFYDGPPFATGLPHHGHLVGATLKDIAPRYFTMKGRYVERRFGWDCHGLPIEHEINKSLNMSADEAVKKLGIKGYNDECRSIVQRYTQEWEKTIKRIGRWVDFENDYKTMDLKFMESVWWVFKQLWEKDLIYQGTKVVPYSTALGTVLSNFEASSNYQEVQDPAVTILFKLKKPIQNEECYLSAWTTTPWTLPSNLGLCLNAEIEYVRIKDHGTQKFIIMAKDRLVSFAKKHPHDVLESYKGSELLNLSYEPLFPYFKKFEQENAFKTLNDNYVTTQDGTGIVHIAPAFGEDDNRVMKEAGVHLIVCPIDDAGKFTAEVSDFVGIYVKEADKLIIKYLKDKGQLFDQATLVHNYPFCPRSDTPLIYRAIPSWYVNVEKIKDDMLSANEQIYWVPEHIKEGRFGNWLRGARDWAISRNRVWGTPLPIWINDKTGTKKCFGNIQELEELTGVKLHDLHREYVDQLTFSIAGEAGTYRRISEVLDCWFESGSMPYAQIHYPFENKKMFEQGFPAEYIAEGLDQTRGWFYTLTVLSAALYKKPAFKNVIVNGIVTAEDGKKMSKRLKNYTAPDVLMNSFGADAFRLYLINSGLVKAEELRFSDNGVRDIVRRALLPWYNAFKFFQTYAQVDNWTPQTHYKLGDNILDRWILSKLQTLTINVNLEMQAYHLYNVVPALLSFIDDLTNWYIRLNRRRFWEEGLAPDKCAAYSTLYTTIKQISLLMAPFAPFLAEVIFLELKKLGDIKEESVHLCSFPDGDTKKVDNILEMAVDRFQQVILLGRQKRNQVQIKVKTPLRSITLIQKDQNLLNEIKKLESYIQTELNIKQVAYDTHEEKYINLFAKPNSPILGKKLGKNFATFKDLIEKLPASELVKVEAGQSITLNDQVILPDEILVFREAKAGTQALSNRLISIDMDCTLDQNLILEGLAREVTNRIQKTRKDMKLDVADRIKITCDGSSEILEAITKHHNYICQETLAKEINCQKLVAESDGIKFEIDELHLTLIIEKS